MFGLDALLSAIDPAALASSAASKSVLADDCSGYCVDNSADYVGSGSDGVNNLLGDGKIYPAQEAHVGQTPMLSDSTECSYYSCDHSADYITTGSDGVSNLTGDGVIFPKYTAFAQTGQPTMLSDSTECSYFSCDHSADYVGYTSNGESNLTTEGTIYKGYTAFSAPAGQENTMLSDCTGYDCDNSADYIGTPPNPLTGDGAIYPKYTPLSGATAPHDGAAMHTSALAEDHHAGAYYCTETEADCDTGVVDPILKPIEMPVIAASQTAGTTSLVEHSGAYYCGEPEASCGTDVVDPTLKPIEYPVFSAEGGTTSLVQGADHSGAYYCTEPEAECSTEVVDPVLKPIEYPVFPELAPALAPTPQLKPEAKPARSTPGHLLLVGHACIFGACEATSNFASNLLSGKAEAGTWEEDFKASSAKAAQAVTPVGAQVLGRVMRS